MAEEDELPEGAGDEEVDPLAEEMLKMMEEEGDSGGSGDDLLGGLGGDMDNMMEMEMLQAMEQDGGAPAAVSTSGSGGGQGAGVPANVARLMDVRLVVTIELGRTRKTIQQVVELGEQSVVELDRTVGEPVNVMVNGKLFARGEVVTVSESFGVRITELVAPVAQL